jgi:outer membrane immunogenic protein
VKKLLSASLPALFAASVAFPVLAADLPSRKAAPVYSAPAPTWTGFYAGLNAGYNFGTNSNVYSQNVAGPWIGVTGFVPGQDVPVFGPVFQGTAPISMDALASNTQSGFIGGGQIGYNYQYGSNFLFGIEADIQGAGIRGASVGGGVAVGRIIAGNDANTKTIGSTTVQGGVDWLGTVRGRVGYLWTPTLLVYGTGGFAYGSAYASVTQFAIERWAFDVGPSFSQNSWFGGGHQNQLLTGWTAGGGVEWMFMPNWSLKAEALYWDLGRMNIQTASYGLLGNREEDGIRNNIGWGRTSVSYSGVQAKAGINYHFNWGTASVVASY